MAKRQLLQLLNFGVAYMVLLDRPGVEKAFQDDDDDERDGVAVVVE